MDKFVIRLPNKRREVIATRASETVSSQSTTQSANIDTPIDSNHDQIIAVACACEDDTENTDIENEGIACSSKVADNPPSKASERSGRCFQIQWKNTFKWLLYKEDVSKVFCELCQNAYLKHKIPMSATYTKLSYKTFVMEGFNKWNKALERFRCHEKSEMHRNAVEVLTSINKGVNVVAAMSKAKVLEMKTARISLLKIISSIKYLAAQGLALRGHTEEDSNFIQLLMLRTEDSKELKTWMNRTNYKWISHDIINEILNILADNVRSNIVDRIKKNIFAIIADETTDLSKKEQFSVCFRIVDDNLEISEYFLGLYETPLTNAETLYKVVKDVFTRYSLDITSLRGQCYDGAANMSGALSGLQKRIADDEPPVYVHCIAHSLNLLVQDSFNGIPKVRDFLVFAKDILNYIRDSAKRLNFFNNIKTNTEDSGSSSLRPFCPTRWCLRVSSLKSLFDNYKEVCEFMTDQSNENSEAGARANAFLEKMFSFEFYFLLKILINIFENIEVLNTNIQKVDINIADALKKIDCLARTLQTQRTNYETLWEQIVNEKDNFNIDEPVLPRKKKVPLKLGGSKNQFFSNSPEDLYRCLYYEIIDTCIQSINNRFNSNGIKRARDIEAFILANDENGDIIQENYSSDFDIKRLQLHKKMFFDSTGGQNFQSVSEIASYFNQNVHLKDLFSEFVKVLKLFFTIPITSCTSERSFSNLRRLKTYLRTTMTQARLNDCIVLNCYRDLLKEVDHNIIANIFIQRNTHRRNMFSLE